MTTSREDDALRLADMYADRVYDYRRHASPETHHDMMVFRNALEGKLRRQHAEIAELRAEVERLEGELAIAKAFHDLAVKERNFERVASSRLQSELNTARTEVERLREDAERYRWLRDMDHWPACFGSHLAPEPVRGSDLDAAIDAALARKEQDHA